MKGLIQRLEEASKFGSWKRFFDDLELDDVELMKTEGSDKRGEAIFEGDVEIYDDRHPVVFTVSWATQPQRISVSVDWMISERDFNLEGDSDETFPIRPGVHEKVADWLAEEIEEAFEEIEEEARG